ncbi:MAG: NAD-dependent epimerase/dehydratase family protein [Polyangiaceae bacterium]|nr:NAD-dependent epimerase/dehydratase family protein [Polyangiaceae bacterium]
MQMPQSPSPILVTGASGYVAGWIVHELLKAGNTVHATVRNLDDETKISPLRSMAENLPGELRLFSADLLQPGSFGEAMQNCKIIFHTASPFRLAVEDPQRDLIAPAVDGTRHLLEEVSKHESVKTVILTSSCAAIYGDNQDLQNTEKGVFDESCWNTSSSLGHQPYSYSKTMAERTAWEIAKSQASWRLVTINPSLVLGPAINPHATSESFHIMEQLGGGQMQAGVPDLEIGIVDVRDVAQAHIAAAFNQNAQGRYLTSGHDFSFLKVANILRAEFGDSYPFPRRTLPKWVAWLFGPLFDRALTRDYIRKNISYPFRADNTKAVNELGVSFRSAQESIREMMQQMIDSQRIKKSP